MVLLSRGKVLGGEFTAPGIPPTTQYSWIVYPSGSSALNSMVWQRGAKDDYDAWAYDLGNGEGWSFESLLPYFEKTENWSPPSPSEYVNLTNKQLAAVADVHGEKGHVAVSYNNYFAGTDLPMIEAAVNLGLKLSRSRSRLIEYS